ncbi:hypothetical protein PR003_g20460 [Phytophthora rubi]|uniref:Uncharacterized protein n=1 Tax=Phytophthora rubi TaxID=129364 RepID=A0A6A3JHC4_9STRA|nr:hypothetical protein PR002_g19897 [Phytophthora rubi]KAE9309672.1 hypothetical protein PR003_g20460 [Phytophthora rubi]
MDGLHPAQQVVPPPLLLVVHCGGPIQDGKQPLTPVEQVPPPLQLLDFCRVIAATQQNAASAIAASGACRQQCATEITVARFEWAMSCLQRTLLAAGAATHRFHCTGGPLLRSG